MKIYYSNIEISISFIPTLTCICNLHSRKWEAHRCMDNTGYTAWVSPSQCPSAPQGLAPSGWDLASGQGDAPKSKLTAARGGVGVKSSTSQPAWLAILCVPSSSQITWGPWARTPCSQPKLIMKSAAAWRQTPSCSPVEATCADTLTCQQASPSATSRFCLSPEPVLTWKEGMPKGLCFKQEKQ